MFRLDRADSGGAVGRPIYRLADGRTGEVVSNVCQRTEVTTVYTDVDPTYRRAMCMVRPILVKTRGSTVASDVGDGTSGASNVSGTRSMLSVAVSRSCRPTSA